MSAIGPRPDISEMLREFQAFANGDVTLKDVAETAAAIATETGSEPGQTSGRKKTGKASAAGAGISAGAEKVAEKQLEELGKGKPVETTAADQEGAGRAALAVLGLETSQSRLGLGDPGGEPDGTLTIAELDPCSHHRKA